MPKTNKKLALNSGIQTYQILTNAGEVCIPSLSSILLAVIILFNRICVFVLHIEKRGAESE